jgi:integrase
MGVILRHKKISQGRVSLYLDIYHNKRRWYEFIDIHINATRPTPEDKASKLLANEIKIKRQHELIIENHGLIDKQKKQADFVRFFESWITAKKTNTNLSATLYQLKRFTGKQSIPIVKVTTKWLKDFETFLLKTVSENTALSYLKNVNGALNELIRRQVIIHNPWHAVPHNERLKKKDTIRTAWTIDQLRKLANTASNIETQFKQAYFFACFSGLRWSDVNQLAWNNIVQKDVNGKTEWFIHFEQQKTGAVEYLPLSDQAVEILKERGLLSKSLNDTDYIFPKVKETDSHRKPVQGRMNYALKKWAKAAGLEWKRMRFHTGRHSYATNLIEATNGDIYSVSKLLGHKSIQTTQIYAQVRDRVKQAAVKSLPMIEDPTRIESNFVKEAA